MSYCISVPFQANQDCIAILHNITTLEIHDRIMLITQLSAENYAENGKRMMMQTFTRSNKTCCIYKFLTKNVDLLLRN